MVRALIRLFALALLALAALPALAAETASLVADKVYITGNKTLVAEGHVEVLYGEARLKAERVTYDGTTRRLAIEGPMTLVEGSSVLLVADMAELDADLTNGILKSARLVLDQQLQLAADEITRVSGRYTQLSRTVASSCQVCAENPVPVWEIRARRVIHDQQERQLYFDRAQFRVMGVPVFYIPRLRLPDPTLKRATGFLLPSVRSSSGLGTGIRVPYFITLGDQADLTVTPFVTTKGSRTLGLRYRHAFSSGGLSFEGAVSRDDLLPGETRGYLFGDGAFGIGAGYILSFGLETVSDPAYLLDYGLPDQDRLTSDIGVSRTRRNEYIDARLRHVYSIRDGETNATLPSLIADATFHRRFTPALIGGEGGLRLQFHSHRRSSDLDTLGRDLARLSFRLDWRRNWVTDAGILFAGMGEVNAEYYSIGQDSLYPSSYSRVRPAFAVELRWPWMRAGQGVTHIVEPVAQIVWSPRGSDNVPNEDSVIVEFDEGNLFSFSRFPGADRYETGLRANLGIGWTRLAEAGWSLGATVGRVFRVSDTGQFTQGSGLAGSASDWLVATQYDSGEGLTLTNRALFDDSLTFTKDELRLVWTTERLDLSASYIWMQADPAEDRPDSTHEGAIEAGWGITESWRGNFIGRYDFGTGRTTRAGLGLQYRNECVAVDVSLSRRFTSSTSLRPTTDFGLSVELAGFGNSSAMRTRRACAR